MVRLVAGPACDRFGPRNVFAACLLIGAIPTALAGTVTSAAGLTTLRFFVGILGGSFVPCQVWSTGFFDKNVVGTANSLTGGWGNAGGGITYFVMPAIFTSLVNSNGLTPHVAWRVAFIVPFILITATAIAMVLLCPDTPTGKWSERQMAVQQNLQAHGVAVDGEKVAVPGNVTDRAVSGASSPFHSASVDNKILEEEGAISVAKHGSFSQEATLSSSEMMAIASGEMVQKPSLREAIPVVFSPQVFVTAGCYFCTFGAELAINSVLGSYYDKNFPSLGQSESGAWAAMFGLLNVVCRPAGGIISDFVYRRTGSVWSKKTWLHFLCLVAGGFQIAIGVLDSKDKATMFGLVAGMAFFLEAGNGANYSLVPHVSPFANGIVSGVTGGIGNMGGIVFAIIFRYSGTDYGKVIWIIGVVTIAVNVAVCWIRPIAKTQIGGR